MVVDRHPLTFSAIRPVTFQSFEQLGHPAHMMIPLVTLDLYPPLDFPCGEYELTLKIKHQQ